jgi:pyruvate dehydrogenase E1 component beta subunit
MPATPYDAKGLMIAAIRDPNPVVYIDDRFLYNDKGIVPNDVYAVDIGKGIIRREGEDATVVAISLMVCESIKAADQLAQKGINIECVDLRSAKPIDYDLVLRSAQKTGRDVFADIGWKTCGLAAEISAVVSEQAFEYLKAPVQRVTLPDCPAPASSVLEKAYYKTQVDIEKAVLNVMNNRIRLK